MANLADRIDRGRAYGEFRAARRAEESDAAWRGEVDLWSRADGDGIA